MSTENKAAAPAKTTTAVGNLQTDISTEVLSRVNKLTDIGELQIPKDYSVGNALKSAMLILQDMKDRDGNRVLEHCTRISIANALFKMASEGLSPMKKQCSFIPYGKELQMQREYAGTIALAKRFGSLKNIVANVVYEGDVFEYEISSETGRRKVTNHVQKLENIDINKIRGAYAITELEDGTLDTEIMTITQIRTAWNQGAMKGNSPAHRNFTDQMCKKTVINRSCKLLISSSDDEVLFDGNEAEIRANANKTDLIITPHEEVKQEALPQSTTIEIPADKAEPVAVSVAESNGQVKAQF